MNRHLYPTFPLRQKTRFRMQCGFSMMEVLVSILVLAIGVIGAAGLQLGALRATKQSSLQTTALQLAAEMADKMRANDKQMKQSTSLFLGVDYQSASDGEPATPAKMCYAAPCNADELAAFDIYEWEKRVKDTLPGGRAMICRDASPWDSDKNSLTWDCDGKSGNGASYVVKVGWQARNPDGTLIQDAAKTFPPSVALTVEPYIQ
jgi:type IV pilus assembly protein PilV